MHKTSFTWLDFSVVVHRVQKYYRHTSRELKRISSVTLSPIYAHFSETVTGIVTIRALRQLQRYLYNLLCWLHLCPGPIQKLESQKFRLEPWTVYYSCFTCGLK